MSLQAVVDPYARADFFLAFGEEGVDLEEGFITFPTLPGGLLAKVGKFRSAFGRINVSLAPGPMGRLSARDRQPSRRRGGDERCRPLGRAPDPDPWFFLEATGQVFRGDVDDSFVSSRRRDLSYTGPCARVS